MEVPPTAPNELDWHLSHFLWEMLPQKKSRFKYKTCHDTHVCISSYHASIFYVQSTSPKLLRVCIYFDVHEHQCQMVHAVNHLTWLTNLLPMRSKNCPPSRLCYSNAISKRLFANYLLKSPSNNGGHHLACLSLDIIMDKFSTIAYPNCHNFILGSKHFVCSGMARWIESWH